MMKSGDEAESRSSRLVAFSHIYISTSCKSTFGGRYVSLLTVWLNTQFEPSGLRLRRERT